MIARSVLIIVALVSAGNMSARAAQYGSKAITATVVDGQTKKPIEDALVIARWIARTHRDIGTVEVLDTVTNPSGKFHFDAWGPRNYEGQGELGDEDPMLIVFKPGYELLLVGNGRYNKPGHKEYVSRKPRAMRSSLWDGETLQLTPLTNRNKSKVDVYSFLLNVLDPLLLGDSSTPCEWRKLHRTAAYLARETGDRAEYPERTTPSLIDELLTNEAWLIRQGCPSPRQVFGDLLK